MSVIPTNTIKKYLMLYQSQPFKMADCFLKELINDNIVKEFHIEENLADMHGGYIDELKIKYEMTNEEFRKYKGNPWYMANDLYGNTELWFMLLHANEMYSATEFTRQNIYVYKSNIMTRISEILNARNYFIQKNQAEIDSQKRKIILGTDIEDD